MKLLLLVIVCTIVVFMLMFSAVLFVETILKMTGKPKKWTYENRITEIDEQNKTTL